MNLSPSDASLLYDHEHHISQCIWLRNVCISPSIFCYTLEYCYAYLQMSIFFLINLSQDPRALRIIHITSKLEMWELSKSQEKLIE